MRTVVALDKNQVIHLLPAFVATLTPDAHGQTPSGTQGHGDSAGHTKQMAQVLAPSTPGHEKAGPYGDPAPPASHPHAPHPSQHGLLGSTAIFCCAFLNRRQGQGSGLSVHPQGGPAAAEDELSTRWAERATTFWKPWKPGQRLLRFPSGSFSN